MNTTADRLEALQSAMYAVCLRVLRHAQDAEDACQEALIEAARQAHDVREDFDAWARRVALTTALDCRRRRDRRRVHETRVRPAAAPAREPVEIDHALAALDEPSRRAVAAHYLDGRPVRELAREAGVSEVAIWKRLVKARGKLRLLFTAALPAAIIGAAVLLVLLRHPAVAPESPATPREEPWPWEMPPRGWPEPVRTTWTALQTRATVESDGMPMREVLDMIAGLIGRPIAVSPDLAGERVSLQVVRTAAEGILRLMLEPRGAGYAIRDDGTIDVARKDALDRALRDRTQSPDVQAALNLRFVSDRIGDARP
ncbi:MAG TPA: sigma-70 family RNA polymerase sigma factor, partial [Planctomycetota bacterium]|nr:sigma-70 family RNA polymerase sigma factor [Planctomycetota bacterium]